MSARLWASGPAGRSGVRSGHVDRARRGARRRRPATAGHPQRRRILTGNLRRADAYGPRTIRFWGHTRLLAGETLRGDLALPPAAHGGDRGLQAAALTGHGIGDTETLQLVEHPLAAGLR